MILRKNLSTFVNLEVYDSIGYVFYYNGKRYVADEIKTSWLTRNSKGELILELDKATEDLSNQYSEAFSESVRNLFNQHYSAYLNAISAMYGQPLGTGKINKGHVAEGYEAHLLEHHKLSYQKLNNVRIDSPLAKMAISTKEEVELKISDWGSHESNSEAWAHIRAALGRQRGTVAGDVGRFQVKQGSDSSAYGHRVRLSSLPNLKRGVRDYCDILNPDIPSKNVAARIATYLSETISKPTKEIQAHILNLELGENISGFNNKRSRSIIHI